MASPAETPATTAPQDSEFDPLEFWLRHRRAIVLYSSLLLAALLIYGLYELVQSRTEQASQRAYAAAVTADDFRKVIDQYGSTVAGANARLMLADRLRAEGKFDESSATLQTFIERHPDHELISGAHASLAANLEAQGKTDEALAAYQKVTTSFPKSFSAPAAWLAQARIFKGQGKAEDARRVYDTVIAQFQGSIFAAEASRESQALKK
jgi:TolA-binding protein